MTINTGGFFQGSQLAQSKPPARRVPACGACGLLKTCSTPKYPVFGNGASRVLVVGDWPSSKADATASEMFGGGGMQLIRKHLAKAGFDPEHDCWVTYALRCNPDKNKKVNNNLRVDYCRPLLKSVINDLKPTVIILAGQQAVSSVIGWLWRKDCGGVQRWAGFQIPSRQLNCWLLPTWSPTWVKQQQNPVLDKYFAQHIRAAAELDAQTPYSGGSGEELDLRKQVKTIFDPTDAANVLRKMISKTAPVAWDYETNCLKPERKGARIISAAVSWRGKKTIAFPFVGAAKDAFSDLLKSPHPKIAANLMFEDRWTRVHLGHRVRNWTYDTMQGSHVHDNRPGVGSVGFQSFAWLGCPDHEKHIKPFLKSKPNSHLNSIETEIKLSDLLVYNGLDALEEYLIAEKLMDAHNYPKPEGM
jgi:uracil-DNA glycosylase family 4